MPTRISFEPVSIVSLDKNNMQLLAALDSDGRMPLSVVAKKIGVSRENAHYRFSNLVSDGVIIGFDLLVNYFALGYKCYNILLNLENLGEVTRDVIMSDLAKNSNLEVKKYLLSDWDVDILVWVRDEREFYKYYHSFLERHSKYIVDKQLFVVTTVHAFSHAYLHDSLESYVLRVPAKLAAVDDVDEKLLDILEKNPREELVRIAQKLSIAATTVAYRIRRLYKQKVILGCMPRIDLSKLGCTRYRIELLLSDPRRLSEVISFVSAHANIVRVYELIGPKDLAFDGDFSSPAQVDLFLQQLKKKLPLVRNFEVRVILK